MLQYFWWSLDSISASPIKGVTPLLKSSPKYPGPGCWSAPRIWMLGCSRKARSCNFFPVNSIVLILPSKIIQKIKITLSISRYNVQDEKTSLHVNFSFIRSQGMFLINCNTNFCGFRENEKKTESDVLCRLI